MANQIIRLLPSVSNGWTLWPAFESRIIRFNQTYLSETTPEQTAAMVQTLRQKWVTDPASTGFWVASTAQGVVGHVCGWLAFDWNQPYAFIYQAEASPGFTADWMEYLDEWIAELNGYLINRNPPAHIGWVEFATFNNPDAMNRLLRKAGRANIRMRSTLRFDP